MRFTINSWKYGQQNFFAKDRDGKGSSYVYLDDDQICEGGCFKGNTILCNGSEEDLRRIAKKWWRQYINKIRKMEL